MAKDQRRTPELYQSQDSVRTTTVDRVSGSIYILGALCANLSVRRGAILDYRKKELTKHYG